jgi:hypothetical protein
VSAAPKLLKMGLGEAMRRLLDVEIRFRHGLASAELAVERDMLLEALNRVEIQLGFDCDEDGMPDTVEIFRESSETSCCRIIDLPGVTPRQGAARPVVMSSSRIKEPVVTPPSLPETPPVPSGTGFFNRMFPADKGKKK